MRRAQGRLGRLARDSGLLALAGVICVAAARASATPAPTLFRLSIKGTAHQEWDHTGAPAPVGDCKRTVRSEGIRNMRFRTARPVVVRFAGGRMLPADVGGLTGTVTLSGANTITEVCPSGRTEAIQDCVTTKRSFNGGRFGVLSTRPGSITLRAVRKVRLANVQCPREPADVVKAPLGPVPGPLRISLVALGNRRITHITLTGSASRRKNYGSPEDGRIEQRAVWTLTFTRVQP